MHTPEQLKSLTERIERLEALANSPVVTSEDRAREILTAQLAGSAGRETIRAIVTEAFGK